MNVAINVIYDYGKRPRPESGLRSISGIRRSRLRLIPTEANPMTFSPELHLLTLTAIATLLMWIPYMLARIMTRGLMAALSNPDPSYPPDPPWAERARRAHANAIENLAVFAPLVLMCAMTGASSPATAFSARLYLGARLVHYVVYAAGIPVVRTIAFLTGFAATCTFAVALLGHAT
ncbi:MAPEG family protein [Burkholderia cenocepacia]|uniref:MAPEG family protein n=1 Tax=Burkholderia cenocepacia TaxID=95486 RepID=UPI0028762F30|nr:MAPEG family protein [Burkholderia cenocepacia]MDS0847559.1 MAPEG family protein [Burkholderia cenocepacia]